MDIRQLGYFVAVVENGTVSGAARSLRLSQPPLSAQLHQLERELGCALFVREGRRLRLTEAGGVLYERAKTILGLCASARDELSGYGSGAAGVMRIGVVSSVCTSLFPPWLAAFAAACPGVRCDLHEGNTYELLEQLRSRQLDIALVRTPFSAPEMEQRILCRETMAAVGAPRYFAKAPGGKADALSLSALCGVPLIVYRRWEAVLRSCFEAAGASPRIFCINDDARTTLALARQGLGAALVPASALDVPECAAAAQPTLCVRYLADAALATAVAAVWPRGEKLTPQAKAFLEVLERQNTEKPKKSRASI